jgi:hypothetical protein
MFPRERWKLPIDCGPDLLKGQSYEMIMKKKQKCVTRVKGRPNHLAFLIQTEVTLQKEGNETWMESRSEIRNKRKDGEQE